MDFREDIHISVVIDGIEYDFIAVFTMSDYEIVEDEIERKEHIHKEIVAKIVLGHICEDTEKLTIEVLPDELLERYIEIVVSVSESIGMVYKEKENIVDIYERFVASIQENIRIQSEKLLEGLNNIVIPQIDLPKINMQLFSPQREYGESLHLESLLPDTSYIKEGLERIAQSMIDRQKTLVSFSDNIASIIQEQQSYISSVNQQISQAFSKLSSYDIDKEKLEDIHKSWKKWGEYGWTIPDHADIKDFLKEPSNFDEANEIASKYCNDIYMESLFDDTKEIIQASEINDYEEAIDDYRKERYKSCACILFLLINSRLITMQPKSKKQRRPVGIGAVRNFEKKIRQNEDFENKIFNLSRFDNIYKCLEVFFKDGGDFEIQPIVANRSFLLHGMLERAVTRNDCNQLFLLYYNWLILLEKY